MTVSQRRVGYKDDSITGWDIKMTVSQQRVGYKDDSITAKGGI